MNARERLTVWAFRTAAWLMPRVPELISGAVFDLIADASWLRNGRGVQRLQGNLARVVGRPLDDEGVRSLTRRGMRSYLRYWRDLFRIASWSVDDVDRRLQVIGREHLEEALAQGRGVVAAGPHAGNWDLAGAWAGLHFGHLTSVAEALEPVELFRWFTETRALLGMEILPHRGGARPLLRVLLERLRAGGIVALVSDRDLTQRGIPVQFFGAEARMAGGPAALALQTGAALIPVMLYHDGDRAVCVLHAPLVIDATDDVASVTQRLATRFEQDIAAHPADWHMLQRVWPDLDVAR